MQVAIEEVQQGLLQQYATLTAKARSLSASTKDGIRSLARLWQLQVRTNPGRHLCCMCHGGVAVHVTEHNEQLHRPSRLCSTPYTIRRPDLRHCCLPHGCTAQSTTCVAAEDRK